MQMLLRKKVKNFFLCKWMKKNTENTLSIDYFIIFAYILI